MVELVSNNDIEFLPVRLGSIISTLPAMYEIVVAVKDSA